MKSVCIKTNNSILLDYLLNELNYIEIEPIIISSNEFMILFNNSFFFLFMYEGKYANE